MAAKKTKKSKNFIQEAIKRPGALTKKAQGSGESIEAFAKKATKAGSKVSTQTKQQANFYQNVLKPSTAKRKKAKK